MTDATQATQARQAGLAVERLWRILHAGLTPGVRARSDCRQVDAAMTELRRALQPPVDYPSRRAAIEQKLTELGSGPPPPWQAKQSRLEGELADD